MEAMDPLERQLRRQVERSREFFWHRLRWKAVSEYLPTHRRFELLDIGAGAGLIGDYLRRSRPQARYRFIEPLQSLERQLQVRFGHQANAKTLASYQGIHFVTLLDVLEHQDDDRAFLSDLVDRMEPGATLLVTVPALMGLWSGWDVALGHRRRYDRAGLARRFAGLPVKTRELSYLFPELIPAGWVRKLTRPAARAATMAGDDVLFPDLPAPVNNVLFGLGSVSLALRRIWPTGASLFVVARRV
jgi:hypothetical protein